MRLAYFDCFSGVSGDMILGALVDAGLDVRDLERELDKLKLMGYHIETELVLKNEISGTKLTVAIQEEKMKRRLEDVVNVIEGSTLDEDVKQLSMEVFRALAEAEGRVHDRAPEDVHFHELGGLDTIIDVVGTVVGLKLLGIESVYSSRVHLGTGFTTCRHGTIPIPAPATVELLRDIPVFSKGIEAELTTPTGAAILKRFSRHFGTMPGMKVTAIGYGAGSQELAIPNLLRVFIGEMDETRAGDYEQDSAFLVETNIDDMNPEFFDHVSEKLMSLGALDVFMTSVLMKKNRPGTLLSIQTPEDRLEDVLATVFTETTSLGVRIRKVERRKLARKIITVKTRFGEVRVKLGMLKGNVTTMAPEYEDCKAAAREFGASLRDVYDLAKEAAWRMLGE